MLKRACLLLIAFSCAVFAADLGTAENPLTIDNENDLVLLMVRRTCILNLSAIWT